MHTTHATTTHPRHYALRKRYLEIADDYIAVGIKRSKFPEYMMPFFALVMLESRMRKVIKEIEQEEGITFAPHPEGFKEAFIEKECGYNVYIVEHG